MMIFNTINSTIDKTNYTIKIANIDAAAGHWGNEKQIVSALDEIETYLYDKPSLEDNLVAFSLIVKKHNPRVKSIKFYTIPEENKIILLATTDVKKFKDVDPFSREISITFKKQKFAFAIIEVLENDKKKEGFTIPENWKPEDSLQKRYKKITSLMF